MSSDAISAINLLLVDGSIRLVPLKNIQHLLNKPDSRINQHFRDYSVPLTFNNNKKIFNIYTDFYSHYFPGAQSMVEEEEEDEPETGMQESMYSTAGGEDMEDDGVENREEDMLVNGS